MKARLLQDGDVLYLLLCTGKIKIVSAAEAYDFILHFDDQNYYSGPEKWNHDGLTMEEYRGYTIASVSDEGTLMVENGELFRAILNNKEVKYLTVPEYAELHGKQVAIVRRFCQNGRIEGVIQKGKTWLIPENSPYPADERTRK